MMATGRNSVRAGLRSFFRTRLLRLLHWLIERRRRGRERGISLSEKPRRFLFLQYDPALGSVINATPLFEGLKAALPDCLITVAASGVSYQVLRDNPFIDRVIPTSNPHDSVISAAFDLLKALRTGPQMDCAVTDLGNMKARIALLAVLSGARDRAGFTTVPELYDLFLRRDVRLSISDDNFRLLELLGLPAAKGEPRLFFSRSDSDDIETLLALHGLTPAQKLVVLVTQTSGGQPTRWFDDRFAALADRLGEVRDAMVLFVGMAAEAGAIERIRGSMRSSSVNLAGKTDIPTLCALMCRSDLVVSLDTGPMHVARAAAVPLVIIAPAWQPAHEWLPLGLTACRIVRRNDIPCGGCRKFFCATHECMDEITLDEVMEAIDEIWMEFPPLVAERDKRTRRSLVPQDMTDRGPP